MDGIYELADDAFLSTYHERDNSLLLEPSKWDKIIGYRECRKSSIPCQEYLHDIGIMVMFERKDSDKYWFHMYTSCFIEEVMRYKLGTLPELDTEDIESLLDDQKEV